MKRQALSHIKTHRLMRLLQIPLYQAVGLLEVIWCHTEEHYHDGALCGLGAEDIAAITGWTGDGAALVDALISAGWLDRMEDGTLIVHDWHDHCPDHIHMRLARAGMRFADGRDPRKSRLAHGERTASAQRADLCAQRAHGERTTQDPRPKTQDHTSGGVLSLGVSRNIGESPPQIAAAKDGSEKPPAPKLTKASAALGSATIPLVRSMLLDWAGPAANRLGPPDDALSRRLWELCGNRLGDWLAALRHRGKRPENIQSWGFLLHVADADLARFDADDTEAARDGPAVALVPAGDAA